MFLRVIITHISLYRGLHHFGSTCFPLLLRLLPLVISYLYQCLVESEPGN